MWARGFSDSGAKQFVHTDTGHPVFRTAYLAGTLSPPQPYQHQAEFRTVAGLAVSVRDVAVRGVGILIQRQVLEGPENLGSSVTILY